jgi:LmbE family N-acetylglucosaminyl deacetylase
MLSLTAGFRAAAQRHLLKRMQRRATVYSNARLTSPLVVVAPHPDDEVLGCGGLVQSKRAAGAPVSIVIVSDGASSHRKFIPAEELRKRRRLEAFEAAARLGVDESNVVLLGFPDGQLTEHLKDITAALADLFRKLQPAEIALPHRWEPPADHLAVYEAGRKAAAASLLQTTILEYGVWIWRTWPVVPLPHSPSRMQAMELARATAPCLRLASAFNLYFPVEQSIGLKRDALDAHVTQVSRQVGHLEWPILSDVDDGAWLNAVLGPREYYRESLLENGSIRRRKAGGSV